MIDSHAKTYGKGASSVCDEDLVRPCKLTIMNGIILGVAFVNSVSVISSISVCVAISGCFVVAAALADGDGVGALILGIIGEFWCRGEPGIPQTDEGVDVTGSAAGLITPPGRDRGAPNAGKSSSGRLALGAAVGWVGPAVGCWLRGAAVGGVISRGEGVG